jgi:hypothetical protein
MLQLKYRNGALMEEWKSTREECFSYSVIYKPVYEQILLSIACLFIND